MTSSANQTVMIGHFLIEGGAKHGVSPTIGRADQVQAVLDNLAARKGTILSGAIDVGKTAIVNEVFRRMAAGEISPTLFRRYNRYELDTPALLEVEGSDGHLLRGEKRVDKLENELYTMLLTLRSSPHNAFIYINNFNDYLRSEIALNGKYYPDNSVQRRIYSKLRNLMKQGKVQIIGEIRQGKEDEWATHPDLKEFFGEPIIVPPMDVQGADSELFSVLNHLRLTMMSLSNVTISQDAVAAAIELSTTIPMSTIPRTPMDILRSAVQMAKDNRERGPQRVWDLDYEILRLEYDLEANQRGFSIHDLLLEDDQSAVRVDQTEDRLNKLRAEHDNLADLYEKQKAVFAQIQDLYEIITQAHAKLDEVHTTGTETEIRGAEDNLRKIKYDIGNQIRNRRKELSALEKEGQVFIAIVDGRTIRQLVGRWIRSGAFALDHPGSNELSALYCRVPSE